MTGVLRLLALGLALCLFSACGPTTYVHRTTFSYGSSGKVAEARAIGGEKMAPYEQTLAAEYLYQAQWLAGYARFQDANRFSLKALQSAQKSREVTLRRQRNDELPIYVPGKSYITKEGLIRRGRPDDVVGQDMDEEKPPLTDAEIEGQKEKKGEKK
jgi:hypothetical protein